MLGINNKKLFIIIILVLLIVSLLINFWLTYQLSTTVKAYKVQLFDTKILSFTKMFVKDILMATQDIDFDTRLSLETTVRGLDDAEIFDQWQRFIKASTREDASKEAKILLSLLLKKVKN